LKRGDHSYRVEGAALRLYADQGHSDAVALIQPWLSRPSQRDVLRSEALRALGSTGDPAALDLLLEWMRPGHPRTARTAAGQGLQQLTHKVKLNEEQRRRVTEAFAATLASDSSQLALSTLSAARELTFASDLLPHVEKLGREGAVERVRKFAQETADLIRKKDAGSAAEVSKLREELQRLRSEQEALRERLNRLEKPMPKR
jgi:HEAT repeat protein